METPSKSTSLPRAPLGSLDANSHILSPRSGTTPHKQSSTMKSNTFTTPGKGLYSLKDTITSSPAQRITSMAQPTPARGMYGEVQQTPSRSNEKRKEAPTSAARDEYDAERAVKQARFAHERRDSGHGRSRTPSTSEYSRQSSASGHAHKLFGEIATRVETEEDMDSSQGTIANSSFNDEDMADASQLTAVSVPDVEGPAPALGRTPSPENLRANAQALKLRLQFAMYKLQTHQEHIPLSHLRVVPKQPRFPAVISSPAPNRQHASRPASPVRPSLSPPLQRQSAERSNQRGGKEVESYMRHSRTPSDQRGAKDREIYPPRRHSRTPSGGPVQRRSPVGEFQVPRSSQSTVRRPSLPINNETDDETDDEADHHRDVDRDTVSPRMDERREAVATPSYAERQDRLLSLANAVEHASSQERQERERSN